MNQSQFYRGAVSPGDCVSNGWNLVQQNYWMFFGIAIVGCLILFVLGCIPLVGLIAGPILSGPIFVGVYYALLRQMRGESVEFGMLFQGFNSFVPAMIVSLVASIPFVVIGIIQLFNNVGNLAMQIMANKGGGNQDIGALAGGMSVFALVAISILYLIAIVVQISLFFALPLIADNENMNAMDAIKLSISASWGNIGGLILLGIFEFLICFAGVLACGIGIFFVLPIIYAANAFAYRQVFPDTKQNFQNAPPTPDSYGNNYGFGQ